MARVSLRTAALSGFLLILSLNVAALLYGMLYQTEDTNHGPTHLGKRVMKWDVKDGIPLYDEQNKYEGVECACPCDINKMKLEFNCFYLSKSQWKMECLFLWKSELPKIYKEEELKELNKESYTTPFSTPLVVRILQKDFMDHHVYLNIAGCNCNCGYVYSGLKNEQTTISCFPFNFAHVYICAFSIFYDVDELGENFFVTKNSKDSIPFPVWREIENYASAIQGLDVKSILEQDAEARRKAGIAEELSYQPVDSTDNLRAKREIKEANSTSAMGSKKSKNGNTANKTHSPKWLSKQAKVFWRKKDIKELVKIASMIQLRIDVVEGAISMRRGHANDVLKTSRSGPFKNPWKVTIPFVFHDKCHLKEKIHFLIERTKNLPGERVASKKIEIHPFTEMVKNHKSAKEDSKPMVDANRPHLSPETRKDLALILYVPDRRLRKSDVFPGHPDSPVLPSWLAKKFWKVWIVKQSSVYKLRYMMLVVAKEIASHLDKEDCKGQAI